MVYEYFNRERVIDHVGAVVLVVPVRLDQAAGVLGTGQQRVLPRFFRCQPIEFPTPPRMPSHRIKEFRLGPGSATIGAHCDLCHFGFARSPLPNLGLKGIRISRAFMLISRRRRPSLSAISSAGYRSAMCRSLATSPSVQGLYRTIVHLPEPPPICDSMGEF